MIANYPALRFGVYIAAVLATIVAIFLRVSPWGEFAEAFNQVSDYLMLIAGVTAATNVGDFHKDEANLTP